MLGKEVICVDAKRIPADIPNHPAEGKVYTVRKTFKNENGKWGIYLTEIVNPPIMCNAAWGRYKFEPNFAEWRFTDLLGQPLDIEAALREELETVEVEVDATPKKARLN